MRNRQGHFRFTSPAQYEEPSSVEDIGLFTFYRNQQQQEEKNRKYSTPKKQKEKSKLRKLSNFFNMKIHKTNTQDEQQQKDNSNCAIFLKNITSNNWKINKNRGELCRSHEVEHIKQEDSSRNNTSGIKIQMSTSQTLIEEQKRNKNIPGITLRTIDQIIKDKGQISPQSPVIKRQTKKPKFNVNTLKKHKIFSYTQQQEEEFNPSPENSKIKKSIKQVQSFNRSFLDRVRPNQEQFRGTRKTSSNKYNDMHSQNQKYFSNLLEHFCVCGNAQNQAARMLKDSLKFPNLKYQKEQTKTEGNQGNISSQLQTKYSSQFALTKRQRDLEPMVKLSSTRLKKSLSPTKPLKQKIYLFKSKPSQKSSWLKMQQIGPIKQ